MVAAATMSLPERAKAGRNYDYRYVWIRDQCYTGQAVAADGPHRLLDDAVAFVAARLLDDGPGTQARLHDHRRPGPGRADPVRAGRLPGGSAKAGNWVNQQFQLDALGEALLLFAAAARHDHLDTWHWRAAEAAVAAIKARQGDPDAGVWELDDRRWTHSRLMCVAGLRAIAAAGAAARQARRLGSPGRRHPRRRGRRTACTRAAAGSGRPAISGPTPPCCCPPSGAPPRRLTPGPWPRWDGRGSDLARDGYLYRFRHDQRPLHEAEGAFVLCGFLMALALHQQGRHSEAVRVVRAQPGRLRATRPAHRGIRRHPAAAARQHPAGVRPRPAVRIGRAADPGLGAPDRKAAPPRPALGCRGTTACRDNITENARQREEQG